MTVVPPSGQLLASAVRTASTNTADIPTLGSRGIMFFVDVTADPAASETLQPLVQVKDPTSGNYITLTSFTAVGDATTPASLIYTVYPGGVETVANTLHEGTALPIPAMIRLRFVHSASGNWTYSVGYSLLA